MVIQDAVDAASAGDTIRIHAGRYEEVVEDFDLWGDGSFLANPHVAVTKDDLTFIGDGTDVTIIGTATWPADPPVFYSGVCVTEVYASGTTISDLAVENTTVNIFVASPSAEIQRVRIESAVEGIRVETRASCVIGDCVFRDCGDGVISYQPANSLIVRNSEFLSVELHIWVLAPPNAVLEDCTGNRYALGFNIQQGSSAVLRRVVLQNYVATGLAISSGGSAEVYESTFEGGGAGVNSRGESLWCEGRAFPGKLFGPYW